MVSAEYLKNDNCNFLSSRKRCNASLAQNNILDNRNLIIKGLKWSLGNEKNIHFSTDIWLTDIPFSNYIHPNRRSSIDVTTNVDKFIDQHKNTWNTQNLESYFPIDIINTINNTPIPICNIKYDIIWKSDSLGQFSIKSASWANNMKIPPHPKATFSMIYEN